MTERSRATADICAHVPSIDIALAAIDLPTYLDRSVIDAHLEICADCRSEFRQVQRVEGFAGDLAVENKSFESGRSSSSRASLRWLAAAALLVGLTGFVLIDGPLKERDEAVAVPLPDQIVAAFDFEGGLSKELFEVTQLSGSDDRVEENGPAATTDSGQTLKMSSFSGI